MSYDLGYEMGYEGDSVEKTAPRTLRLASPEQPGGYLMNGVGGPPPNLTDPTAIFQWLQGQLQQGPQPGAVPGGGTPGVGQPPGTGGTPGVPPTGFTQPQPVAPGAPNPAQPTAVDPSAPTTTTTALQPGGSTDSPEWRAARDDLAAYGMSNTEIDAFRTQYAGRSVADLRSSGVLPQALPRGEDGRPIAPSDADRIQGVNGIRTRLRDDMIGDLSSRIQQRMPGLSPDTCQALAEQMYRRTTGDQNIGSTPPSQATIQAMGVRRGDVMTSYNQIFPSSGNPTTIATSDSFQSLNADAIAYERGAFSQSSSAAFQQADSAYYGGANPNAVQRGRRDRDARLFLQERRIADDPGAMRRLRRDPTLAGQVADFHRRVGNEGTTQQPSTNPSRRALEAAMSQDPVDRGRLTAQQRFEIDRADHQFYMQRGETIRQENVRSGEATVAFGRQEYLQRQGQQFQLGMAMLQDAQARRRDEENNKRQQIGQLTQNAMNHGMQMMQSQIQMLNNLTLEQLRAINQTTSQLIQAGSPRPFDIVAQMLGGGGGRR